jgi:hypothetical protein
MDILDHIDRSPMHCVANRSKLPNRYCA